MVQNVQQSHHTQLNDEMIGYGKQANIPQQQPLSINDDILKRLQEIELKIIHQGKFKLTYNIICNEPIHPSMPSKVFPYKFEIPKIENYKGKKNHRENIRLFKYSY